MDDGRKRYLEGIIARLPELTQVELSALKAAVDAELF